MSKQQNILLLTELLALLRALQWHAWVVHWQLSGPSFYGDHLLFQRIYGGDGEDAPPGGKINEFIDTLGEKLVALYGPGSFSALAIQRLSVVALEQVNNETSNPLARALALEEAAQRSIVTAYTALKSSGAMSLGMDNFLQGMADDRETALYLLRQRMSG